MTNNARTRLTRRNILRYATASMGLACLGPLGRGLLRPAAGAPTGDPFFVIVNLLGGNDGLNTVIPVTQPLYYSRRNDGEPGSIAIPSGAELSLAGGPGTGEFGLHPSLVNLQSLWNDGDVAIFPKVGYPGANLSHFTSQDIYSYGVRDSFSALGLAASGWVARMAERYAPTSMGAVSIGVGRPLDFVGGSSSPLQATSLGSFKYDPDYAYRVSHEHRLDAIQDILDTIPSAGTKGEIADAMGQGHALAEQIQAAVASYDSAVDYGGATPPAIARFHRDIATLVQYGFETRLYYTGFGGFDTHANQGPAAGSHATLLGRLDGAIGAFAQDMKAMGAWDSTVLVVISEFGRRNYQNGSNGTDHGHGNFFFAIGGGVRGGVYGGIVSNADLEVEYLAYDVDFRDIYKEVLDVHLGMDPAPIFPEAQPSSTTLGFL